MIEDSIRNIKNINEFKIWCSTASLSNLEYLISKYSGPHKQLLRAKVFPLCSSLSCYIFDKIVMQYQADKAIEDILLR